MTLTYSPEHADRRLIGQALQNLREAARPKIGQRVVGAALSMTTQAWQKYEAGEREFTEEKIATALRVIGATLHDLEAEKARILGAPPPAALDDRRGDLTFNVFGRARDAEGGQEAYDLADPIRRVDLRQILGPNIDALEMAGDSMAPWAEPGEIVLFDRDRYPKRGAGCVVEMRTGQSHVKFYEKSDGSNLFVRELFPEERTVMLPLDQVRGVYAVRLRGD